MNCECFPKCFGTCEHCFDANLKVFLRILTWQINRESFVPHKFSTIWVVNYLRFIFPLEHDKPDIRDLLLNVIHQHAAHWEILGELLGLEHYNIANISKDHRNQAVDACREMLIMWLRVTPSPTWGKLDDAIRSMMTSPLNPRGK